jgi:hypothetical protein
MSACTSANAPLANVCRLLFCKPIAAIRSQLLIRIDQHA